MSISIVNFSNSSLRRNLANEAGVVVNFQGQKQGANLRKENGEGIKVYAAGVYDGSVRFSFQDVEGTPTVLDADGEILLDKGRRARTKITTDLETSPLFATPKEMRFLTVVLGGDHEARIFVDDVLDDEFGYGIIGNVEHDVSGSSKNYARFIVNPSNSSLP